MSGKRRVLFTTRKHPLPAVFSAVLGLITALSLAYAIVCSFLLGGDIPGRFGAAGAFCTLFSLAGIVIALYELRQPDVFKLFPVLGLILNGGGLVVLAFLLWIAY